MFNDITMDKDFDKKVYESDKPVILFFYQPLQEESMKLLPQIKRLRDRNKKVNIYTVDMKDMRNRFVMETCHVFAAPCFVSYKDGFRYGELMSKIPGGDLLGQGAEVKTIHESQVSELIREVLDVD